MTGLTKKELTRSAKDIRGAISQLVKEIDTLLREHKVSCDLLRATLKEYNSAKAAFEKKDNAKTAKRLENATADLKIAYGTYIDTKKALDAQKAKITDKYKELLDVCDAISDREKNKATTERDDALAEFDARVDKVEKAVADNLPDLLTPPAPVEPEVTEDATEEKDEADTEEKDEAPTPATVRPAANATVASVNIAPVSIDISAYVERAISATMDRLAAGMERKIDAYIASLEIPAPVIPAPVAAPVADATPTAATVTDADAAATEALVTTARANNELINHLYEEQTHVYDKLRTMITNVQGLVDGMTDLSASYLTLAEREREAIEVQKQINDMQRHIAREQQGVQVNQKLISDEQIAISAEQGLMVDRQRAVAEKQSGLLDSQRNMEEMQKALVETHMALEEAMKAVMLVQKEIIATQQAIINGNVKNQEAGKSLIEKQAELTAMQKEALAAHKQLIREQKAHNEKLTGKPKAKKPAPEADKADSPAADTDVTVTSPEGSVVTEKATPAPDASLLNADDEVRG